MTGEKLSDKAVARLVKQAAADAGLDPERYSGHSLRAGLATAAGDQGAGLAELMRQTRHKSTEVALGYLRPADLWRNNVTERVFGTGGRRTRIRRNEEAARPGRQLGIGLLPSGSKPYMLVRQEVDMTGTVKVVIPVEADAASALTDPRKREAIGRIVSRILRPQPDHDPLLETMERLSADAKAKGWTPELLEAELAAHKAERAR